MVNSSLDELDSCINCNTGLIAASSICPQCGWPKGKPIESVKEEIEVSTEESTEIKNRLPRPIGVRLISISYMLFGISLILFGIIFVSAVMFLVMSDAMSELGGIGGGMGNMPMLPGMGGIDASTKSSLGNIIDLNRIASSPSASEIEMRMNSSGIMNMDVMMDILAETAVIAVIEIIVGLVIFGIGLVLVKGKKWARPVTIISSIISIPLVVAFVTADTLVLLGMAAFNGVVLYYMLKSKAREYFAQAPIKKPKAKAENEKPKIKKSEVTISQPDVSVPSKVEQTTELMSPQVRPTGVLILAILIIINGIIAIGLAAFTGTVLGSMGIVEGTSAMFGAGGAILGAITGITAAIGVAAFVIAWGLLDGKSWSWTIALIFTIISLVMALPSTNVVGIIIDVIILYYLFRPHVKDYFGKSQQRL